MHMKIFHTKPNIADLLTTTGILAVGFVVMVLTFAEWYSNGKSLIDWAQEYLSYVLCVGYGVRAGWFAREIKRMGEK